MSATISNLSLLLPDKVKHKTLRYPRSHSSLVLLLHHRSHPNRRPCFCVGHQSHPNPRPYFCISTQQSAMGQVLDRLQGKEWRRNQIRKITDKVFDHFKNENGTANLTFEDVYIGVLLVYNDINKHLPGPHFNPPSKDSIRLLIQEHDINLDGEINREEFAKLIKQMTADTFCVVSRGLIVTLVAAPTVAMATKRATEGVPHVGKVVQRIPTSVYASLVTLIVVLVQHTRKEL
ncbi:PREDICTED: uncharacterized protein LOC101298543 [Fragaria vesca subsp. vesca]|uniref:uncharacterized protein LOC101298543 n=1 Tax=Fragaria vesca subsp. vesca TaxID=101020 RepID=UPI0002C3058D|nr:PREDICTED: uncharacterized protein LOC101298543 [Fragaria vesca subsp. vesca]